MSVNRTYFEIFGVLVRELEQVSRGISWYVDITSPDGHPQPHGSHKATLYRNLMREPQKAPFKGTLLTGPKPKEIKVETFRIDYLLRTPKIEKVEFTANKTYRHPLNTLNGLPGNP